MNDKLEFTLVPMSGTLEEGGGYRATLGDGENRVLGLDTVIKEAKEDGSFFGVSEDLMKLYVRGILQSMIDHTAKDGITRRIDNYLSVSLKIHGRFESEDEDFDPAKHEVVISLRPLGAFRPEIKLQPVNVNRKGDFRIYSIVSADGGRKNLHLTYGQDIIIRGSDLLAENGKAYVNCDMQDAKGVSHSATPTILTATAKRIVCHWPQELLGEDYQHGRMCVTINKYTEPFDPYVAVPYREKYVAVYL